MNRKHASAFLVLVQLSALGGGARAQQAGSVGAGVILGQPIGGTAKFWVNGSQAVDVGIGVAEGDAVFHADYLWHSWDLLPKPKSGKLAAYAGLGPRLQTRGDGELAIRTIGGLGYWTASHPIELFLEVGPVFRLTERRDVGVDAGLGVRFYTSR